MKQRYELTVCGVKLDAFASKPDPEELAYVVAYMDARQQAQFIMSVGEALHFTKNPVDYQRQLYAIREAITEDEADNVHSFSSDLIRDLQIEAETVE